MLFSYRHVLKTIALLSANTKAIKPSWEISRITP